MLIPLGVFAASGAGAAGAYELISSTVLGSATSTVEFTSIASTYKHLQIRFTARANGGTTAETMLWFNGDIANWSRHFLIGNGSTVTSSATANTDVMYPAKIISTANVFTGAVIDILDYASTSKYKTARSLAGFTNGSTHDVSLRSGAWRSTSAVSSIGIYTAELFATGSRFSLYGIKG